MLKAWMKEDPYISVPLIPCSQVVVRKTPTVDLHPPQATCDQGITHLRRAFRRVFLYIPASSGSGMQISPPDTVTNSPFGVVLQQGWRGGSRVSVHRQKTRQGFDRPMARWQSFLMRLGRILSPSCSQANRRNNG